MAKYTLNTYGWSFEAVCKSLTDEQVQLIKDKMEEEGFSELHEIRFDLDELLDLDFWDGEIFHKTEAFDNGTMHFELLDEEENKEKLKQHYYDNIEKIKEYREKNKERRSFKIICACGSAFRTDGVSIHEKSLKHKKFLDNLK